ncbi:MAG: outer rane efflux protein [Cyanobacteria bacterium RYN_339]|nr:outer rane efflux protein [Cyanobacteria bacterium RYN_339]
MIWASLLAAAASPPPLDQEALVRQALAKVPAIAATRLATQAQQQRVEAARGGYWPAVTLNAGLSRTTNASNAQTTATPFDLATGGVGVHQELYNFGRTDAQVEAAQATLAASTSQELLAGVEVAHQARRAYVGWVQALGLEDQAGEQRKAAERVSAQAQAFFRAGARAKLDVTRAKVAVEQAKAAEVGAHTAVEQANAELATAVGAPGPLVGQPDFAPVPPVGKLERKDLAALADAHPQLLAANARLAQARAALATAEATGKPDLGADGTYGVRARDWEGAPNWQIGLSASWLVFNGGALQRTIDAARLQERSVQQDFESQRQAVQLAVSKAHLGVKGAAAKLPAVAAALASAKENVYQAEGRYKAGVGSIIEVSDAEGLLAVAEGDQVRATGAYHLAIADLIAALGMTGVQP